MSLTLDTIRFNARRSPSSIALSDRTGALTFTELTNRLALWSQILRDCDIQVLAIVMDNSPEWVCLDLAAQASGVAVVPVPAFFSPSQMRHAIEDSGADAIAATEAVARELLCSPLAAVELYAPFVRLWRALDSRCRVALPEKTAKISYTSGTTGQPKGVCLSMQSMDAVAIALVDATSELDLEKHLCLLPLPTLLENVGGAYAPLIAGAEVVVPRLCDVGWTGAARLDIARLTRLISQTSPSSIILVPEMLRALTQASLLGGWKPPRSLRFVAVGGGHVSTNLLSLAEECGLPVFEGYGLTECASVVALNTPTARRLGSVGKPLQHADVRIGRNGEVKVKGAAAVGYTGEFRNQDDEVATGDLGYLDKDGYLHIYGRIKNIFINSFGRNISPDWVEPEFQRSPVIRQIAMFGEARPWNVAVIVAEPGASDERVQAALDVVNAELPDYARIGQWLHAREPFTLQNGLLTANGRTRRDAIWNSYKEEINERYDVFGNRRAQS